MNSFDGIVIIGLTGQSGAGKTTVSQMLRGLGFSVINCDEVSHTASALPEFLDEMRLIFPDCVDENGLIRQKLGMLVFNDHEKLGRYGKIIFPYITYLIFSELHSLDKKGEKVVILDAPTLFESGLEDICSAVISVIAPYDIKLERAMVRDGATEEFIKSRLQSQFGEDFFRSRSDFCIVNDGDISSLKEKVSAAADYIKGRFDV